MPRKNFKVYSHVETMILKQNDLEILDKKYSTYVILLVHENPGSTKTDIMRMEDGNEQTKFSRINDLIEAGILEYRTTGDGILKKLYVSDDAFDLVMKINLMRESYLKFESVRKDMETMKKDEEMRKMFDEDFIEGDKEKENKKKK